MVRSAAMAGFCALALGCARPRLVEREPAEADRWLAARWKRIESPSPRMGVRELFSFALEAASVGWHPERIAEALGLAEQMQDRDEASRTFGNFRWYWNAERPEDLNAVEFSMQQGVLLWMFFRDALDAEGTERLERLIRFSVEGLRRHNVPESYTNIFLMKTWNCIAIGEATGRPGLAEEGYQMLDRWLVYTWEHGIREYISPTYYGVDLDSLALIAKFAGRRSGRRKAEAALRLFWADIAANWYEPGNRLGGAHSRDYDYLTGHGYLDVTLRAVGWLDDARPIDHSTFRQLCTWAPPASVRRSIERRVPRVVLQRWGAEPWERAVHYVGRRFTIGSAGATYGPMDKPLAVNLPGGRGMPVVSFFMDARGDPYGKKRFPSGGGHQKALHLQPFLASVQRGGEVLLLASADPASRLFRRRAPEPTCLLSHVVIPSELAVWLGEDAVTPGEAPVPVPEGRAVFLRLEDVAVGIRFLYAVDTKGKPAPVELVKDGGRHGAMRLTATHSPTAPEAPATVAVWVRAAEGLDEAGFAAFRRAFAGAAVERKADGHTIDLAVPGRQGELRLAADLAGRERLGVAGAEPGLEDALLAVNGRDHGREILGALGPVAAYQRLLKAAKRGTARAPKPDEVIEAESAALVVAPFRLDADASASGGKFLWMPGEPGGKHGSAVARALWLIHIPKAGSYYLWGRVQAPTPSDDSFFVRVRQDGREVLPRTDWHTGTHPTWEWTPLTAGPERVPRAIALQPGVALVEVHCREDGTRLDALCLSAKPMASPPRLP